jgi:hypothetical protein
MRRSNMMPWIFGLTVVYLAMGLTCAGSASDASLVLYYPFEEGLGGATADMSGSGNDGTLVGDVQWTEEGRYGKALAFTNKAESYVDIGEGKFDGLTEVTVEMWFRLDDGFNQDENWEILFGHFADSNNRSCLYMEKETGKIAAHCKEADAGWDDVTARSDMLFVDDTSWHHAAYTVGDGVKLYIDGELQEAQGIDEKVNFSVLGTSKYNRVSSQNPDWADYFGGTIDEVAIYSRILTAAEIRASIDTVSAAYPSGKLATTWGSIRGCY